MSTRPRFWLRAVLALVLLLAVAAAFGWQRWRHWTPARTDYPMQGLAA
jgi:predicted negative regulator of RcsB-dependent stress response